MSFARSSCNTLGTARPRPLASRFHSICDCPKFCGTGDCRVHTQSTRTGYSPAHTAKANCRTGQGSLYKAHLEPAAKEIGIVGHFGWHTFRHTYGTLLKGNGEDVKVVQELMRHANVSVTLNIYAQAITQTKRDAQSRVVSLLLDKNEEKPSTEAYRTVTDLQNSGGDLQVVDKVGVPDGI
jgi:hypothetical protein